MARLPVVDSDDGIWGGILNEFLEVEHNPDGTLKNTGTLGSYAPLANPTFTGTVTIPSPTNATDAVTKQYVDNLISTSISDATFNTDTDISANSWVVDEDNMSSDTNTKVPTQQSVKAYVDNAISTPVDLNPNWETGSKLRINNAEMDTWINTVKTSTNPINVVVIGDSLTVYNSNNSYPYELERRLSSLAKKPPVSVGWRFAKGAFLSPNMTSFEGANNSTDTLAGYGGTLTAGQKGTMTGVCDGVSVVYRMQSGGGSLIVRDGVGGTVLTTINTNGSSSLEVWTSNALSDGSRTIEIEASGGSVLVDGVYLHRYNRSSGIRVWNCGRSGSLTQNYDSNSAWALDLINHFADEGTLGAVLIGTGTNDTNSAGDGGATQLTSLYGNLRSISATVPIFIWIPYMNVQFTAGEHSQRLAAAQNLTNLIIDGNAIIPDFVGNPAWDSGDSIHLNTSAGLLLGQNIALAMSGNPIGQLQRQMSSMKDAYLPLTGGSLSGTLTAPLVAISDGSANASINLVSHAVGSILLGTGSSAITFGNGTNPADAYLNRVGPAQLAVNKSEGTISANISPAVNTQTGTSYTLVLSDAGKQIVRSNSAASTQTLPQDSEVAIPVGTQIKFINTGTGNLTFQAGTGALLLGATALPGGSSASATKIIANTWYVDHTTGPENYTSSHEHSIGFYGSRIGMNKWRTSTRDLKHVVCWGDSVTQGGGVDAKNRSYVDGFRQILTNETNEQVHEGMQPMFWATGGTAWRYTTSGGWASVAGQNASNLSPLGLNGSCLRSTNSTLRTITWTRPSHVKCTRFIIYWVDDSTVTSGAKWSYSVNGGSTWTEVSTASPGSPTLKTTEVTGVNDPADIRIRNADAAGTTWANSPAFMGIDIRHGEYGWVVHNYGGAGASLSLPTNANSCGAVSTDRAGDWKPWFNLIQPELVVIEFSNDTAGYNQATFETAIQTACSHLNTTADLVAYGFMHQDRLSGGGSLDAVRTHTRSKVLQYNGIALDMNARWTNMASAKANGFMNPAHTFAIHPTELGDNDVASALGRLLRSYG